MPLSGSFINRLRNPHYNPQLPNVAMPIAAILRAPAVSFRHGWPEMPFEQFTLFQAKWSLETDIMSDPVC